MEFNTLQRIFCVLEDPFLSRVEREQLLDLAAAIKADKSTGDLLSTRPIIDIYARKKIRVDEYRRRNPEKVSEWRKASKERIKQQRAA